MFPIKYIDNNLVWNKDNEVFAYYELIPYNYSFLSAEQKFIVHDSFRQLIAQSREGKIHALQIATESSIRSMQEQSKKLVTGKLREVALEKIDEQTEALVSMIGDNQVDYRFFLGFKLMVTEEPFNLKNIKKSVWLTFTEFLHEVNHTLMNDFVSMTNDEINRYMKMEKLLENKISRRFKVRRLEIHDFGYLMEHLYGRDGIAYEDYEYQLPKKKLQKETLIKYYDLIRPIRCVIEENQRYLRLEHEDKESYVSYFTVNAIVGELDFPSSEIFYFQQQQFTFPVDTSMNVEIVENRKALTTVRNKKKELKDLDNHAYQAGSETSSNVVDAGLPKVAGNYEGMVRGLIKKYNKYHTDKLPNITPHSFRHTYCTNMANRGMNPNTLQYLMGHANITMTLGYYAHGTFQSAKAELERLAC